MKVTAAPSVSKHKDDREEAIRRRIRQLMTVAKNAQHKREKKLSEVLNARRSVGPNSGRVGEVGSSKRTSISV